MTNSDDYDNRDHPFEQALKAVETMGDEIDPYHHLLRALRMINIGVTEIERAVKKQHTKLFPEH